MSRFVISRPRPLFRPELKTGPAHPAGDRVLVREFPVEAKTEGGIEIADVAKEHLFAGTLIAAGDQACDRLYDLGYELGDEVWYAKYAGVIQKWQHIVADGSDPACAHGGAWEFVPKDDSAWAIVGSNPNENMELRSCRTCGAVKLSERVIIMSVDDIHLNVDVLCRFERGELIRRRGVTADDKTRYYIERTFPRPDTFETRPVGEEPRATNGVPSSPAIAARMERS
jgi:co-chaperonin GroES (HSP10)